MTPAGGATLAVGLLLAIAVPTWAQTTASAYFQWTASTIDGQHAPPSSYNIKCGTVSGGPYTIYGSVLYPKTDGWATGLPMIATPYYCVVTGVNADGEGPPSNEVVRAVKGTPSAPSGLMGQ